MPVHRTLAYWRDVQASATEHLSRRYDQAEATVDLRLVARYSTITVL